jgi:hypothetical protein
MNGSHYLSVKIIILQRDFNFCKPALGPIQPPIQWVPWALSLEVKQQRREADHSPPSSADVKNDWSFTSNPPMRQLPPMVMNN